MLTLVSEEEAFWLFYKVMNHQPCQISNLFGERISHAQQVLHVASQLIHKFQPKLYHHFELENVHVTMYATQWLLTRKTICKYEQEWEKQQQ